MVAELCEGYNDGASWESPVIVRRNRPKRHFSASAGALIKINGATVYSRRGQDVVYTQSDGQPSFDATSSRRDEHLSLTGISSIVLSTYIHIVCRYARIDCRISRMAGLCQQAR